MLSKLSRVGVLSPPPELELLMEDFEALDITSTEYPPPHTHTLRIGIPDRGLMNFGSDRQRMSPSWPNWTLPLSWRIYKLQTWLAQNMPYPRIGCVGDFFCGDRFIPRGYRLVLLLRWRMCIIAVKSILLLHGCKMYWNIICENGESSTKLDGNPTGRRCRP